MTDRQQEHVIGPRPMFSFLTTAYRTEATLPRTIDAVRLQTRSDWELIVVDNGNSDAIARVVAPHLSDPRIRLIRQENRGPIGGVMSAAEVATGRYFVVLNSDDSVEPDFCACMGRLLEADPGIAAVTCDAHQFADPGAIRLPRSYLQSAGVRGRLDGGRPLCVADVIDGPCPYYSASIRRDVWEAMGGMASDIPMVADLDFWLRTLACGHDVRMIPDKLGWSRIEAGSESRPTDSVRSEMFEKQRERALVCAAERSGDPADIAALERVLRRLRYRQAFRRAGEALQKGSIDEARRQCRLAFRQRKTARASATLLGLWLAPSTLRRMYPAKQRLQQQVPRTVQSSLRTSRQNRAGK